MTVQPKDRRRRRRRRVAALLAAVAVVVSGCRWQPLEDDHPFPVAARLEMLALLDAADAAETAGDPDGAADLRAQADAIECDVFGCAPPRGETTVDMDPSLAGGFFSAPWPSDTRLAPDGSLDLAGFPGRSANPVADLVLGRGEAVTYGFGTNSAVYFQASGPVDVTSLPFAAENSVSRRSNAMLLPLDDPTAPLVPVLADTKATGTALRPANLVTLLPYPGHPLEPSRRYAALVFDGARDADGSALAPSPLLAELNGPAPLGVDADKWAALAQDHADVEQLVRDRTLWHPSELVAFTVFTTQDTTGEMQAVAAAVEALAPPEVLSRPPDTSPCPPGGTSRTTGRLAMPVWQEGTRPFIEAGGGIEIDPVTGRAVQQGVEMGADGNGVILEMSVPCGPAPADGWPILLWMSGTGGSAKATNISQLGNGLPFAVLSVAPLYSGDRLVDVAPPWNAPELQFFNYTNPLAARTNIVQQAADTLYLARVAQHLTLAPGEAGGGVDHLDADTVVMAGHSQGATSLPLTLAVATDVDGAFLSAGGAGLYHSILHRGDVRELVDGLLGTGPDELDEFHPYPQILQTFAEVGDAANHAGAITTDVALYAGLRDGCTSIEVAVHLAQAMGIPIARPLTRRPLFLHPLLVGGGGDHAYVSPFEPSTATLPVSQNMAAGRTAVMVQVDADHFGASDYPAIGRSFVDSIAAGGPTTVDPGPTPAVPVGTSCPRHDPVPTP